MNPVLISEAQIGRLVTFLEPETIAIDAQFQGPPQMGNGGYVCGRLAELAGPGPLEITLRKPVPLSRPLTIERLNDDTILLCDNDTIIAEAIAANLYLGVPAPPTFFEAIAGRLPRAELRRIHPFGQCFVCGPDREDDDGLCLFPGQPTGHELVAAHWVPSQAFAGADGHILPRYLWSALDCPGAFATGLRPIVLGRLIGVVLRELQADQPAIVTGWHIAQDGRKNIAGTAIFTEAGDLVAKAKAVWFDV